MSNSEGLEGLYKQLVDTNGNIKGEEDLVRIYNEFIHNDKNIDMKTDLESAYPLTMIDTYGKYLEGRYKKKMEKTVLVINMFSKTFKGQSTSINGKGKKLVLDSLSRFVDAVHNQRTTMEKAIGIGDKGDKK